MATRWGRLVAGVAGVGVAAVAAAAVVWGQTPAEKPAADLLLNRSAAATAGQQRGVETRDVNVAVPAGQPLPGPEAAAERLRAIEIFNQVQGAGQSYRVVTFAPDGKVLGLKTLFEEAERASLEVAKRYHATRKTAEKERLREQLTEAVGKAFDLRQEWRKAEVAELTEQLKKAQDLVQVRQGRRDEIVGQRVGELVQDERTAWNPPGPGGTDPVSGLRKVQVWDLATTRPDGTRPALPVQGLTVPATPGLRGCLRHPGRSSSPAPRLCPRLLQRRRLPPGHPLGHWRLLRRPRPPTWPTR